MMSETDVIITECADGTYCCGNGEEAKTCCLQAKGMRVVDGQVLEAGASVTSSASKTASITELPTLTASSSATNTAAPEESSSSNQSAVIGGAVGGSVGGVMLIVGVAVYLVYRRRRGANAIATPVEPPVESHGFIAAHTDNSYKEMASDQQRFELYGAELPEANHR